MEEAGWDGTQRESENLLERVAAEEGGWMRSVGSTDVGCDDLSLVAGEDDIGNDANVRVSVKDVRFDIITIILPSRGVGGDTMVDIGGVIFGAPSVLEAGSLGCYYIFVPACPERNPTGSGLHSYRDDR